MLLPVRGGRHFHFIAFEMRTPSRCHRQPVVRLVYVSESTKLFQFNTVDIIHDRCIQNVPSEPEPWRHKYVPRISLANPCSAVPRHHTFEKLPEKKFRNGNDSRLDYYFIFIVWNMFNRFLLLHRAINHEKRWVLLVSYRCPSGYMRRENSISTMRRQSDAPTFWILRKEEM